MYLNGFARNWRIFLSGLNSKPLTCLSRKFSSLKKRKKVGGAGEKIKENEKMFYLIENLPLGH